MLSRFALAGICRKTVFEISSNLLGFWLQQRKFVMAPRRGFFPPDSRIGELMKRSGGNLAIVLSLFLRTEDDTLPPLPRKVPRARGAHSERDKLRAGKRCTGICRKAYRMDIKKIQVLIFKLVNVPRKILTNS